MPVNRNALIRFRTIDKCLRNRFRKWTLNDLIEACSEALYEYEGIEKGVSRRTVQMDIQTMRSDKLGYNAPIVVMDRKFYTYEDPEYSITNIPLSDQDLDTLTEVVEVLKQFKGFSHFEEIGGMVRKLEDKVHRERTHERPLIMFEKNEDLHGLHFLDVVYTALQQKLALKIRYQSFKAKNPNTFMFHPHLLREFRNRWFVVGTRDGREDLTNLALDRIAQVETVHFPRYEPKPDFDPEAYYKDVIGVSVATNGSPKSVILLVDHAQYPYISTKSLHPSQQVLKELEEGVIIRIEVQTNFELERDILGYGEGIQVLGPKRLKNRLKSRIRAMYHKYVPLEKSAPDSE